MADPKIIAKVEAEVSDAVRDFDKVADSSETMSRRVKKSSEELGESTDKLDGKASAAERGFRGFSDSLNGTSDVMGGLKDGNLVQLGMGMADLFGSVQDLFLPLLQQMAVKLGLVTVATEGQTTAQEASNIAMSANPIGLIVIALAALAAAFYVAWTHSETFRDVVLGALEAVRVAFDTVVTFFKEHWEEMLAVLTGGLSEAVIIIMRHWDDIRGAVSRALGVIKDVAGTVIGGISTAFAAVRDAVQWVIDKINELISLIKGPLSAVSSVVHGITGAVGGAVGAIGGVIGKSALGAKGNDIGDVGVVSMAGNNLALSRAPVTLGGGGNTFTYYPAGYNRRELTDAQRRWQRINGGKGNELG